MGTGANDEHDSSNLIPKSKSARRRDSSISSVLPSGRSVPYGEFNRITTKYNKLLNDHTSLKKRNAEYQKALDLMEQKGRDIQLGLLQWKETAEYWIQKCSSLQRIGSEMASMLANIDAIPSDPRTVSVSFSNSMADSAIATEDNVQLTNPNRNTVPSSSQTTEVPDEDQECIAGRQVAQLVPSISIEDDVPIILKSRSLKRKRNSAPERLGQPQKAKTTKSDLFSREIKHEIPSSPVLQLPRPNPITQESTFDLDELGENVKTPRKICTAGLGLVKENLSQVLSKTPHHSSTASFADSQTVNVLSAWPVFKTNGPTAKEQNVPKSGNYISPQGGTNLEGGIVLLSSEKVMQPTVTTNGPKSAHDTLRQLSPNIHGLTSRKGMSEVNSTPKRREDEVNEASSHPDQSSIILRRSSSEKENLQNDLKSRKRLAAMLELAPQSKTILEPEPTNIFLENKPTSMYADYLTNSHESNYKSKPETLKGNVNKRTNTVKAAARRKSERLSRIANTSRSEIKSFSKDSQDEVSRLRNKPLERLKLDDFKINPKVNQGCDHAFTEVIRGRDMRSCLPGCTKMDCCGRTFQKVIEVAGIPRPTAKRQSLWDETQEDQGKEPSVVEENRLLRWFLGEDANIDSLSEEDRKKELLSAQTKAFADQHGKHRHAFERSSTPPGFWRTDMPSTQEVEYDRGNAKKTELEKKEERYREAMKPEGKWRFRDEC